MIRRREPSFSLRLDAVIEPRLSVTNLSVSSSGSIISSFFQVLLHLMWAMTEMITKEFLLFSWYTYADVFETGINTNPQGLCVHSFHFSFQFDCKREIADYFRFTGVEHMSDSAEPSGRHKRCSARVNYMYCHWEFKKFNLTFYKYPVKDYAGRYALLVALRQCYPEVSFFNAPSLPYRTV